MEENRLNDNLSNQQVQVEEEGLSLKQLFYIVKKHLLAIILFVVIATGFGYAGGKVLGKLSPKYTASGSMMVSVNNDAISATQAYQYSSYISKTFVVFVKEDVVIDHVAEQFKDQGYTTRGIKSGLSVSLKSESLVLAVSFTSKDPQLSKDVVLAVMNKAESVANEKTADNDPKYPLLYGNLSPLSTDQNIKISLASSTSKYTLIGFAVGAILAFAYVALREMFDNSFRSSLDIEKELGIPVIAEVPYYEFKDELDPRRNSKEVK